jgi:hypothetical protein
MAIEYSATAGSTFIAAVDAAFADDKATGHSTHGWIVTLFGRPIDWKSGRQPSVSISSTEAEHLTLSHAARMVLWWKCFFLQLNLDRFVLPSPLQIYCDNQMVIDHVIGIKEKINTNICYVKIRGHWLREHCKQQLRIK